MSVDLFKVRDAESPPRVLVVDDDKRVLELLEIAFSAHGFRVSTAADGDEALRRAQSDRPDLVVLDVRLPRKSGLEVCEWLRKDPDEPHVPIILVSAAIEPETRLQAFRRGADDYLAKPFSPKELIARARRLIVRASEAREARRRTRELEREVGRAHDDARRAQLETRRERRLRDVTLGLGRDLHLALDPDELAHRLLPAVQFRFGVGVAALLLPFGSDGCGEGLRLEPAVVRGDDRERLAPLRLAAAGPLVTLVAGLRRPVRRRELERFPELGVEGTPLLTCGIAVLAPLPGPRGLEGLLALDERRDGRELLSEELELLGTMCELAGTALHNACRVREQSDRLIAASAPAPAPGRRADAERLIVAARLAGIEPRQHGLLAHVARLGGVGRARVRIAALAADPLTASRVAAMRALIDATRHPATATDSEVRRAATLLVMAETFRAARRRGIEPEPAFRIATRPLTETPDPALLAAFEAAFLPPDE